MKDIFINQATGLSPEEEPLLRGDPTAIIFTRTVVLTPDGKMILNFTREAAEELAEALQSMLRG